MARTIGTLAAGGDNPGLNAAVRAVGKAAQGAYGMHVLGFRDGFLGLMKDRFVRLNSSDLSGILTRGGTILGTSRAKGDKVAAKGQDTEGVPLKQLAGKTKHIPLDHAWIRAVRHLGIALGD